MVTPATPLAKTISWIDLSYQRLWHDVGATTWARLRVGAWGAAWSLQPWESIEFV